jgi:hypothetical protein
MLYADPPAPSEGTISQHFIPICPHQLNKNSLQHQNAGGCTLSPAGGRSTIALRVTVQGGASGSLADLMQQQGNTGSSTIQGAGGTAVPVDSIVILRVEDGGDLFLSVTGR